MKFLEISQEIEQSLVHVFDAALKASGMSLLQHIDKIRNSIQFRPPEVTTEIPKES